MISIQPKWVAKILNGEKTIEIRKSMPKCEYPIDVYIYCTKDNKEELFYVPATNKFYSYPKNLFMTKQLKKMGLTFNGEVVAKFTLNKIRIIGYPPVDLCEQDIKKSCLSEKELLDYSNEETIYGWCIDNLEIFDETKELGEFYRLKMFKVLPDIPEDLNYGLEKIYLTKAPQSWQFIEVEK